MAAIDYLPTLPFPRPSVATCKDFCLPLSAFPFSKSLFHTSSRVTPHAHISCYSFQHAPPPPPFCYFHPSNISVQPTQALFSQVGLPLLPVYMIYQRPPLFPSSAFIPRGSAATCWANRDTRCSLAVCSRAGREGAGEWNRDREHWVGLRIEEE